MSNPNIFFLIGFMGSGKSYLGHKIAKKLEYDFVDLDKYIESETMLFISDIFARYGEGEFRRIEADCLRKSIINKRNLIVSCGGGTPFYNSNWEWMQQNGTSIYLKQSEEILFQRLKKQKIKRPLIQNMDDGLLIDFIKSKLSERENLYLKADFILEHISLNTLYEIIKNKG